MINTEFKLEQWLVGDRQISFLRLVEADVDWKGTSLSELRVWFNEKVDPIVPFKVDVALADKSMDQVFEWIRSQTTGMWMLYNPGGWKDMITFAFSKDEDAVHFRLRWS